MRKFLFLLFVISGTIIGTISGTEAQADELEQAYKKEYAYLVAEKKALEQRLDELTKHQEKNLNQVKTEIEKLQSIFLKKQNQTDRLNRQIVEASRGVDHVESDTLILDTTLIQSRESLKKLDKRIDQGANTEQQLEQAFTLSNAVITADGETRVTKERYFLPNGEAIDGEILHVGRIARYGIDKQGGGILAPAGHGQFKVWNTETQETAQQLTGELYPQSVDVFLFDSADKGIEKEDEKTFTDDVEASGMVGSVIIFLGLAGLSLVVWRFYLLWHASANIQSISEKINNEIKDGDVSGALEICKSNLSAAANVMAATLRNLNRERDHIEDIISESILHESSLIDRFGSAILVIAAVSPLLGLLGTVTGMISTFDIITEFGTGDPKLLSSGISEALLTTKFGLVVAIPLLLMGNIMSSWGQTIKNEMEQAALHMINTHKI